MKGSSEISLRREAQRNSNIEHCLISSCQQLLGTLKTVCTPATVASQVERMRVAVERIRARGGEVVFVRPPSSPELRGFEERTVSRARGWDTLLAYARVRGVHFDDYPEMQGLVLPENSHLSRACATVFTDAYVRAVTRLTPRLTLLAQPPPPLAPADCEGGQAVPP